MDATIDTDRRDAQLAQLYRVLVNDCHTEPETAAAMVDALMAEALLEPTRAQAVIMDRIGPMGWDVELYLFRDACYSAWLEACAKLVRNTRWVQMTFDHIEYERSPLGSKWTTLEKFCKAHNLKALAMVQRWTAQPDALVVAA